MSEEKSISHDSASGKKSSKEKGKPRQIDEEQSPGIDLPEEMDIPLEIDEGPSAGPVDEIQAALFEAAQSGMDTEVEFDRLVASNPNLEDAPQPKADLDEVQKALQEAAKKGISTDVEFDTLPMPAITPAETTSAPPPPKKTDPPEPKPDAAPVEKTKPKAKPKPRPKPAPLAPTPSEFWMILALFVVFRLLTLFLMRPGGYIRDWSDFDTYFGIAALSDYGLYPFLNFWLEWPPLVPWLAVGAYKLALYLPPWPDDPRLWFILIMGTVFVLFEIGNFVLISRLARRITQNQQIINRVLWLYALLFPPVYAMLGFFDGITLFFILLALDMLLAERRTLSAIAIGVGIMVKVVPVLMLPVALRRIWHQHQADTREAAIERGLYAVIAGLTVIGLLAPFLLMGPQWVLASVRSMMGRSSWETIWAVIEGYYGFGVVLGNRLNPAETNFAVHESILPWWLITLVFVGIYAVLFLRKADYSRPRNVVAFTGLTTVVLMLYNKGYSPQFLVYVLPFILLTMPNGRGITYALILTGLNVLEQPIYFVMLPTEQWLLTLVVTARTGMWLILGLEFGLVLWPIKKEQPALSRAHQFAPKILGGLAVLALVGLVPVTIRAYSASQESTPVGAFTGFMDVQAAMDNSGQKPRLLLSDQSTYRQMYPYLHSRFDLQLTDGVSKEFTGAATTSKLISGLDRVWILPTGPQGQPLNNALAARGTELAEYQFDGFGTASLYSFEANPLPFIPPARFIGGIELLAHHIEMQPGSAHITLYWRVQNQQNQNLTVFTQILNEAGELIAGHDSVPRGGKAPVTTWSTNAVQTDIHHIELPPELPPGDYTVIIGLYNDSKERIRGIDPDGFGFANRAVPLEVIRWQ